jgi:PilZ domain
MSEIMRSVIKYLSEVVGGLSCARRRRAQLPLSVSLVAADLAHRPHRPAPTCVGTMRDISTTGLSFTLPSGCLGSRHLFHETLRISIELPEGEVSLRALPTRYDSFGIGGYDAACEIGARIVEMDADSRARLHQYLHSKRKPVGAEGNPGKTGNRASAYGV